MVHAQEPVLAEGRRDGVTGWIGWIFFAGIIIFTGGFVNIVEGIVALLRHSYYLVGPSGLVVNAGYTAWGWTLTIFGVLLLFAGYGIMAGQRWARVTGVILAAGNAVLNMLFIPAYPIWAVIAITIDVLVIYALAVHGAEARQVERPKPRPKPRTETT